MVCGTNSRVKLFVLSDNIDGSGIQFRIVKQLKIVYFTAKSNGYTVVLIFLVVFFSKPSRPVSPTKYFSVKYVAISVKKNFFDFIRSPLSFWLSGHGLLLANFYFKTAHVTPCNTPYFCNPSAYISVPVLFASRCRCSVSSTCIIRFVCFFSRSQH